METLQYNTKRTQLIIPEYGRHVQLMINQIMETRDRDERNKMAKAVIGIMGNMNPHLRMFLIFNTNFGINFLSCLILNWM